MKTQLSLQPAAQWAAPRGERLVMAGPCSVENPSQIYSTVEALAATGTVDIVRGGIWKPRTRPGSFEGIGEEGLPLLKESSRAFGLQCMTEVATPAHVEAALRHNIDMLWIGARTTVNPFSVQELAEALRGTNVPVWVKNPVCPDLGLWVGAVERLHGVGLRKLGLIHRGFSAQDSGPLRNVPEWTLALKMKQLIPDAPLVCDPSHIAGRRDLLSSIAHKALNLGMDGLMVESHINPDEALSDAKQQITPDVLASLLAALPQKTAIKDIKGPVAQLESLIVNLESRLQQIKALAGTHGEAQVLKMLQEEVLPAH